ncbi:hypothetical protein [Azohydromonas aeria]|uniref:hypothetical protein n=1 Tax=Azohydromonas aeria TaxID=2590212 RepID=UPI0012FCDC44|nr:hypothetical protein [Azohydromonas aeria]
MNNKKRIWLEGFHAGQALDNKLPYSDGTPEAMAWLEGWVQGIHANGHSPGKHESSTFDDSEFEDSVDTKEAAKPHSSRWKQFIKNLLG